MERSSAFWLGSGGATFDGAAVETFNASYNTDSDLLLSDEDYGTIEPYMRVIYKTKKHFWVKLFIFRLQMAAALQNLSARERKITVP